MDLDLDLTEPEVPKPCKASRRKTRYKESSACPRSKPSFTSSSTMPSSLLASSPQKKKMKRANVVEKSKDTASQDKSKGKYKMSQVENVSAKKSEESKDKSEDTQDKSKGKNNKSKVQNVSVKNSMQSQNKSRDTASQHEPKGENNRSKVQNVSDKNSKQWKDKQAKTKEHKQPNIQEQHCEELLDGSFVVIQPAQPGSCDSFLKKLLPAAI